jgi:hypothetical protein
MGFCLALLLSVVLPPVRLLNGRHRKVKNLHNINCALQHPSVLQLSTLFSTKFDTLRIPPLSLGPLMGLHVAVEAILHVMPTQDHLLCLVANKGHLPNCKAEKVVLVDAVHLYLHSRQTLARKSGLERVSGRYLLNIGRSNIIQGPMTPATINALVSCGKLRGFDSTGIPLSQPRSSITESGMRGLQQHGKKHRVPQSGSKADNRTTDGNSIGFPISNSRHHTSQPSGGSCDPLLSMCGM